MKIDVAEVRKCLKSFDFKALFREQLGWDNHKAQLDIQVENTIVRLTAVAQKRGFVAFICPSIPDRPTRLKIDRQVTKSVREHFVIYTDQSSGCQIWQWVRREPGKPLASRDHRFDATQSGDPLIQRLDQIAVAIDEEEDITVVDVAGRARSAFDVEKVTKRFYDRFQNEHAAFLKFISGITERADHEWYASVMLNRLMFVYFIQRKGFLDGDRDYLRNRLNRMRAEYGKDKFYSFYRYFLIRLFHEGLGGTKRSAEIEKLIGRIPYLNGGLFDVHELERQDRYGKSIQIPDKAFERIFDYFDQYQWHLDERPLRADNEINPDVLGYIFEKYINQKQMGAYYTKEDITEYISKNTVLPFLFDTARTRCKVAFENPQGPTVWDLLRDDPDRYIYTAVRHGASELLSDEIATGLNPPTLNQPIGEGVSINEIETIRLRKNWNKSAPANHALPTETWREVIARRKRYEEVRLKLAAGKLHDINDLITLNLDIRQFAQDVIENCEGPELLRALWYAIDKVTVLDPTCGSGAFLFAALNILEPLYEACLDRMEAFVADLERSGEKHRPEKFLDFRKVLANVASHPNRRYFIFKNIILNNLYGVDIMEEAVEICKLRLFLKLAAQVEPDVKRDNFGIEPLPDVDFNIKAGNTLVGFASLDELRRYVHGDWIKEAQLPQIEVMATEIQRAFEVFRESQIVGDGSALEKNKIELRKRLADLQDKLNRFLADEYGIEATRFAKKGDYKEALAVLLKSHQPFHWFVEFYGIMKCGGFDVIIGNPPYVELTALTIYRIAGYKCEDAGNLYAIVMERCYSIGKKNGRQGFIVPVSSISTDRYSSLQQLMLRKDDWFSSYDDRPSRLFDGLEHIRLAIHIIGRETAKPSYYSTRYNKWSSEERQSLFSRLAFSNSQPAIVVGTLPKLCTPIEQSILQKLTAQRQNLAMFYRKSSRYRVYYSRKVGYFLQVLDFEPRVIDGKGRRRPPSEFKEVCFGTENHAKLALGCLNSSLFFWFITVFSDCRHINKREVDSFPLDLDALANSNSQKNMQKIVDDLMKDLKINSTNKTMKFKHDTLTLQCIYPKDSKEILDKLDCVIAQHYKFTEEELDFIINYDIRFRMGTDAMSDDE